MLAKSGEKLRASEIDPIRLKSIIPLRRQTRRRHPSHVEVLSAEQITGLSEDTLKRRFPDKIRYLSPRRKGMQLGDAIGIADGK
jgi:hypothetical protein